MLRKHDAPRQFVYYSKSVGQGAAARKYLQQEQCQLTGPGPSGTPPLAVVAPQSGTSSTVLSSHGAQVSLQPPMPASQPHQQFAAPPPAPPCPPVPWLGAQTHQQIVQPECGSQATQPALPHWQQQDSQAYGMVKTLPPLPPPLPPLPWVPASASTATKLQQAGQQQAVVHKQAHPQLAAPLPPQPLPPLPFAAVASTNSAANTPAQQPSQLGRSAQFALPPAPPPLPPQYTQRQGNNRAKLGNGRSHLPVPQQHRQPPVSGDRMGVKAATPDVHMLVAQQAAAAALKRQQRSGQLEHRDMLPQAAAEASRTSETDGEKHQELVSIHVSAFAVSHAIDFAGFTQMTRMLSM